jgi:hypothetical protein
MEQELLRLLTRSRAAVTIKDDFGYCTYANELAGALRGQDPKVLIGKHISEMAGSDPRLVEREFERMKAQGAWVGQYPSRDVNGDLVFFRAYNFVRREWDGTLLYLSFAYPLNAVNRLGRDGPAKLVQPPLTALDVCIAQLYVDGYTDAEIALLMGVPTDSMPGLNGSLVSAMEASSKTEACLRALKSKLVV